MPTPMTPTMTLEQFARTRRYVVGLGDALDDCRWDDEPVDAAGFVYVGDLYIEAVQAHWPEAARAQGGWCLTIGSEQQVTNDLGGLEERLYRYALDEGYVRAPVVAAGKTAEDAALAAELRGRLAAPGEAWAGKGEPERIWVTDRSAAAGLAYGRIDQAWAGPGEAVGYVRADLYEQLADTAMAAQLRKQVADRDAELKTLRSGYDRMLRETGELAAALGAMLGVLDDPDWYRTIMIGRKAMAAHRGEVARHG